MPGRFEWLLIAAAVFAISALTSYADEPTKVRPSLQQETDEAFSRLTDVCNEAWKYDNLRRAILTAAWPDEFHPPQIPAVHLSPGCPDYRRIVGEIAYWGSLYASRKKRLAERGEEQLQPKLSGADEDIKDEIDHVERELDQAKAGYRRACAWAWPYFNLRPRCHQPGFEAATIVNPFIPVPKIRLSEGSPDYKEIVTSLDYWEPRVHNGTNRLKDLHDDRAAAEATGLSGKPSGEAKPPEDPRLAEMFSIYQRAKPALQRWRTNQHKVEALAEPWYRAKQTLTLLQVQAQQIQGQINLLVISANDPRKSGSDITAIQNQVQALQCQLATLAGQITTAQTELAAIETQVSELQQEQSCVAQQTDASMEAWVHLCDVLGRLDPAAHKKGLPLFDQWIAEEPRLWQLYMARGTARLHASKHDEALADLKRVDSKLRLYDARPKPLAFITAIEAYATCKRKDARGGERLFTVAKRLDKTSWTPWFFHGWSNLERERYPQAKNFQTALQMCSKVPQAEAYEAMALLLAACPVEHIRDGDKAVEHATRACDLTKEQDWISLDALAAAYAEAGDFDSAVKSANKALACASAESQEPIRQRIALYQDKKPYRLK